MLLDYLDIVRMWPIAKRKRFAMTLSIGITGIIVLVWLSVLLMGPEPQTTASLERPVVPVATEQGSSSMWDRLRASIGMTPEADTANPQAETQAPRQIPPEALSEFHNTFDEPVAPAPGASTTNTVPAENANVPATKSPATTPEPEESGSMVESVLKEVER